MKPYVYNNSSNEDLFLVTSATPDAKGIGSIFVRDLILGASDISIHCHTEKPFLLEQPNSILGWFGSVLFLFLARFTSWHTIRLFIFRKFVMNYRLRNIEAALNNRVYSYTLLTTSSPELIAIGRALVCRGHNLHVIVWDAPEYLVDNLRLGSKGIDAVMEDFDILMTRAQAAAVISKKMVENYCQRYGISCVVFRHGTAPQPRKTQPVSREIIKIVFAGSLYCKREWNAFIAALDFGKWRIAGRVVGLVYIGRFPVTDVIRPKNMEYYCHLPHSDALDIMSGMDIGYLPYWTDPHHEIVASTSFPSKMTAYAAAGLSIFHHGPVYSSVTEFLEEYPFGLSCSSLDPKVIFNKLEQLVLNMDDHSFTKAREQALQEELSDYAMNESFRRFLSSKKSTFDDAK